MTVRLIDPIALVGRTLVEVEFRLPGRDAVLLMKQHHGPLGFDADAVPRLISRLSSVSEATAQRLSEADRENIRGELEALYQRGGFRFAYREAVRNDNWDRRTEKHMRAIIHAE